MSKLSELLFPSKCICCRELLSEPDEAERKRGGDALCHSCRIEFEAEKHKRCGRCGKMLIECECMPEILARTECFALMRVCGYDGRFDSPVTRLVFTLKKKANGRCERFAAEQLAGRLRCYLYQYSDCDFCVTYIPRRKRAVIRFGHDHGELLAKKTAELCGLDFFKFIDNRGTFKEQKNLDFPGRVKNARSALSPSDQITSAKGKNVILIDDITTSGASLAAGTDILMEAGAASVACLCFASTVKKTRR